MQNEHESEFLSIHSTQTIFCVRSRRWSYEGWREAPSKHENNYKRHINTWHIRCIWKHGNVWTASTLRRGMGHDGNLSIAQRVVNMGELVFCLVSWWWPDCYKVSKWNMKFILPRTEPLALSRSDDDDCFICPKKGRNLTRDGAAFSIGLRRIKSVCRCVQINPQSRSKIKRAQFGWESVRSRSHLGQVEAFLPFASPTPAVGLKHSASVYTCE